MSTHWRSFERNAGWIVLCACGIGTCTMGPGTLAQDFVAPANSLSFEDSGTLEGYQQGYIRFRDSKSETWMLKIVPETKLTVEGETEPDYLRPGLTIEFVGQVDKKNTLAKPIADLAVVTEEKPQLGFFEPAGEGKEGKPVRNAGPGNYFIRAKVASYKEPTFIVSVGSKKLTGNLAEEVTIKYTSDDPGVAQVGDNVKVKAHYYDNSKPVSAVGRAGQALAEEVTVTLAKRLAPSGKKPRPIERPARSVSKGK